MMYPRTAIGCGWPLIESKTGAIPAALDALSYNIAFLPEMKYLLLHLGKAYFATYRLEHKTPLGGGNSKKYLGSSPLKEVRIPSLDKDGISSTLLS
jgi:hypothetical protein